MKKVALVLVLLWTTQMHAGVFKHVLKPVGKAVATATVATSKAVVGGGATAGKAAAGGTATAAKATGKAVKKVVV
jgi:hypothetical protein